MMHLCWKKWGWLTIFLFLFPLISADASDHHYKQNEPVELWVNKVGPYANPQEAYEYYTLPYCNPKTKNHPEGGRFNELKVQSIGEYLGGHALRRSGYDITFNPETPTKRETCTTGKLTSDQVAAFTAAVKDRWFYQMYLDDLPVWGMVGEMLPSSMRETDDRLGTSLHRFSEHDSLSSTPLKAYLYTSRSLFISYNVDQIVKVDLTSDPASLVEIEPDIEVKFVLDITWERTNDEFRSRFDRYLDQGYYKHSNRFFCVLASFTMLLFLKKFVASILVRTLKKDYARNSHVDERNALMMDEAATEDAGWKQVHGDVFRAPHYLSLFAALVGTGWQLVVLVIGVIFFALLGPLHGEVYEERGEALHSILVCYTLFSIVAGYTSGSFFQLYYPTTTQARRFNTTGHTAAASAGEEEQEVISEEEDPSTPKQEGIVNFENEESTEKLLNDDDAESEAADSSKLWLPTMGLTAMLFPTVTVATLSVLNSISTTYGAINTLPFLVLVKLFFIWIFVSVPLCVLGTLLGRYPRLGSFFRVVSSSSVSNTNRPMGRFPCRVNAIPRPIPEDVPWYGKPQWLMPLAGLLNFGSIVFELSYVFTSLWKYKFYHVYGFLMAAYAIMTCVVGMTSIIVVYLLLNAENYYWQWTAFGSGASISLYVVLYGVYYFMFETQMNGFLQTSFYFGYVSIIALFLGLICGALSHGVASHFVHAIFQNAKAL